jgi:ribosomal protein L23
MSKLDVRQYLEKMYNVSVMDVRTRIVEGIL